MFTLENLNEKQRQAVETLDKPLLILAGAGSGKTRTIISRIVNLLDKGKAYPGQIMAITFTNKAAREMKERIEDYNIPDSDRIWMSTIHSACTRILRYHADRIGFDSNFKILDAHDQSVIIRKILKRKNIDVKKYKPNLFSNFISNQKNQGISYDRLPIENLKFAEKMKADVYGEYTKELNSMNAMDFDDILLNATKLLKENPDILEFYQNKFHYIFVDEFQDSATRS